jgi:hypothetical protein
MFEVWDVSVERLVSTLLSKEEGMRMATRSKAMLRCLLMPRLKGLLFFLPVKDVFVPPGDSDER